MSDNLQVEWSTSTMNVLLSLMSSMSKSLQPARAESTETNTNDAASPEQPLMKHYSAVVKIDVSSLNAFLCNNHKGKDFVLIRSILLEIRIFFLLA